MKSSELKKKYVEFFKKNGHKEIPNASLIPENDPTVLFTTAGMHPLVPYLLGEKHPLGKRLVNVQKCLRTRDIEEVGDGVHLTFFEMLGNWSLGDYWKKDAIRWSFEFLTDKKWLGFPIERLAVSVFKGDKNAPRDWESAKIWLELGIPKERIAFLGKKDNWWGPAGKTGPCGPDTEMFYWVGEEKPPKKFDVKNKNWVEIWNDVFMGYNKDKRLILVDGMHCLYDKNFKINKRLLEFVNSFNTHSVLVTNGFREKGLNLIKKNSLDQDTNWGAFSLEEDGIKKDNPEYFKVLLKRFNLSPEEIIYFDHNKKNVETAKKLGILSKHYTTIESIKNFIKDNLWAFTQLKQKNVDTGFGFERVYSILEGKDNVYDSSLFFPMVEKVKELAGLKKYDNKKEKAVRKIVDHLKASVFVLAEGISPGNIDRGYVLRRLIRTSIRYGRVIGIKDNFCREIAKVIIRIYNKDYPYLREKKDFIFNELEKEEIRFRKTLERGLNKFERISKAKKISGKDAFLLFQSFGFPIEMTLELATERKIKVDVNGYKKELKKHQELSRTATKGRFKSGLADHSEDVTKLHTATHLLNEALRIVLKKDIYQKGSNITPERTRFDFNFERKLTSEEIEKIESLVNKWISEGLEVKKEIMSVKEAKASGAHGVFDEKYGEKVYVYFIGDVSKEICAGPHVKNTKELGRFKIKKQESVGAGVRRIKAVLE
jgi:HAD superfamily hydrolase (TIGR01509 family)